jgi:hypothetical protein
MYTLERSLSFHNNHCTTQATTMMTSNVLEIKSNTTCKQQKANMKQIFQQRLKRTLKQDSVPSKRVKLEEKKKPEGLVTCFGLRELKGESKCPSCAGYLQEPSEICFYCSEKSCSKCLSRFWPHTKLPDLEIDNMEYLACRKCVNNH